jgi:predicted Fe-S protein YdhL (DUF1289 family)
MDEMIEFVPVIESPCVNICRIEHGLCAGCARTPAEIARWGSTTDADRSAVMAQLPARMAGRTRT